MMERENAQNLAERIAALLQEKERGNGDDFLRASLEKINRRLDVIESNIGYQNSLNSTQTLSDYQPFHSSQEKFLNLEEFADEIINNLQNEKACPFEPTGKPCDNCAMCNSRGF
jgi:hypothetical protein